MSRVSKSRLSFTAFLFLVASSAAAQITIQGGSLEQDKPAAPQEPDHPPQLSMEFKMTPGEAAHLLASVDEVLAMDSKITGLPIRGSVERKMTSRAEIKELASKRMQDSSIAETVQRSSAVLMKFGLLPRDFNVQQYATETTVNQLAGYYDPRVKTMYLLDWLPADGQLAVLAHELEHALQDQNFHLEEWLKKDDPTANVATGGDSSEQKAARRAVVEGQATAVMLEYVLSKQGRSLTDLPVIPPERLQAFAERFTNSQTTQSVPLMLREEMVFPYIYGFTFVHQVLLKGGREQAYSGLFKRPPESTRQILEPGTYLAHEKLLPLALPPFDGVLGSKYQKIESGSMGEFDCMTLMKQFNSPNAHELAASWRGDYFYATQRVPKSADTAKPATANPLRPEDVSLIFVSRWATRAAARQFAAFYIGAVPQRYSNPQRVDQTAENASWNTSEGRVAVEVHGNLVIALESFEAQTASQITAAVLKADIQ